MRLLTGTNSGGQVDSTAGARVRVIVFKARAANTGPHYIGRSDVSTGNGFGLEPGEGITLKFNSEAEPEGSEDFTALFTVGNGKVDWAAILEH